MNRHMAGVALLASLAFAGSGATLAQSPSPPRPTFMPAASYQPMPATDPVAAVDAWLDALVARRWTQLPALTCQAERGAVASFYDARLSEDPGPEAAKLLVDAMKPEIVERSVTLGAISGDSATVTIGGTLVFADLEAGLRVFVVDLTVGADPSPSREWIEEAVASYARWIRSYALAPEATVVREGEGWLTCTRLQVYVDPSPES